MEVKALHLENAEPPILVTLSGIVMEVRLEQPRNASLPILMPLSDTYNGISVYKLPFNICIIMAVFVPFAQFNKRFASIKPLS